MDTDRPDCCPYNLLNQLPAARSRDILKLSEVFQNSKTSSQERLVLWTLLSVSHIREKSSTKSHTKILKHGISSSLPICGPTASCSALSSPPTIVPSFFSPMHHLVLMPHLSPPPLRRLATSCLITHHNPVLLPNLSKSTINVCCFTPSMTMPLPFPYIGAIFSCEHILLVHVLFICCSKHVKMDIKIGQCQCKMWPLED